MLKTVTTPSADTYDERRSFHLYVLGMGMLEIGQDSDFDVLLKYVPQMSYEIPALRSAMFCIANFVQGLMADSMANSDVSRERTDLAHASYVRTIRSLITPQERGRLRPSEVLLACIILRCIESYRHDYSRAAVHMKAAVSILAENDCFREARSVAPELKSIIDRLALKAAASTGEMSVPLETRQLGPFMDPEAAMDQLNYYVVIVCRTLAAARTAESPDSPQDHLSVRETCLEQLDDWQAKLRDVLIKFPEHAKLTSVLYALIQYQIARIILLNLYESENQRFESCTHSFRAALELCHQFAQANDRRREGVRLCLNNRPIRLGFAIELIPAVFFIAYECRNPEIRNAALDFLNQAYRRELGWDSHYAARVAQRIVELEEQRCPKTEIQSLLSPISSSSDESSTPTSKVKLLGINFFRNIETDGDAFRRPDWALLQFEQYGKRREEWLDLHDGPPRAPLRRAGRGKFTFSHRLQEPFMPSAAAMMTLAWEQGVFGHKDTISASPGSMECD